uniref:Uncharacterized protein n=1 Tax=Anguilla anguilla TaxID=7936 RepID=A0A0E9RCD8_ANGAN
MCKKPHSGQWAPQTEYWISSQK